MYALFRLLLGTHFASRATVPCTCALLPACVGSEAGGRQGGAAPSLLTLCPASSQNLTYEIILTLGQAFEVAYQLALQAQKARPMGASATEVIETRSSKPVPKPRVGMRKSAVRGPWAPGGARGGSPPAPGPAGHGRNPARVCLLCSAPQVPPSPDSRCCQCHTRPTHRPSYLPLPSVSPGAKVSTPAVCVRLPAGP